MDPATMMMALKAIQAANESNEPNSPPTVQQQPQRHEIPGPTERKPFQFQLGR